MNRLVLGFLFAFFATTFLYAKKPPALPKKIATGRQTLELTERERFNQVMGQLGGLGPEATNQLHARAALRQAQMLANILPEWTHDIPLGILFFLDFIPDEQPLARARKYLRLALLIRDMYLDLPLNREVLETFAIPADQRITDAQREEWVAQAFAAAAELVVGLEPGETLAEREDYWLSLAQLDYWTFYHLELAGPNHLEDALQAANRAYNNINQARNTGPNHGQHFWDQLVIMENGILRFAGQIIAPVLLLAIQYSSTAHSK